MKIEDYKNKKIEVENDLKQMKKKSNLISWLRVVLFVLIVVCLAYGYFNKINAFYILMAALTAVFFVIVKIHNDIEANIKYKLSKIHV